jgi:tetratricopeptide (TPR) repeat protein
MCIHAYEQAVEKAPDNSAKAEALIGLGIVHGKYTGLEEAKTHIFQAWRLARDKITGLLAIVALSLQKEELTNADRVIANAVYEEIRTITDYDMLNDVATISSAWFLAEGNLNDARNCILRAARRYPWNPALWNTLAHFLIECHGKEAIVRPLIRKSVARASVWERTSELLIALSYLLEADVSHGMLYAKKAVHSEPYVPSTWAILILALYRQMGGVPCKKTLNYTLDIARKALTLCTDQFSSIAVWLQEYAESVPQLL